MWRSPEPVSSEPLPFVRPGQVAITRGGHATVLIRYHDTTILCDPLLSRSCKGVPRVEGCGLNEEDLDGIDLTLISNTAADHLHRPSIARLPSKSTVVVPRSGARELSGLEFERVLELAPGQGFSHLGVEVATAAGAPDSLLYVIRGDGPSVLFCGASGASPSFADLGDRFRPDVALLPIGGYSPRSFRRRHLTPSAAIEAFEALRARVLVPHRYGAFVLSYETLEDPLRWLTQSIADRELERYLEVLETGASQLFVPPRGRARTHFGAPHRTLGRGSIPATVADSEPDPEPEPTPPADTGDGSESDLTYDSEEFEIDEEGEFSEESDESLDQIEVDPDLIASSDESLREG